MYRWPVKELDNLLYYSSLCSLETGSLLEPGARQMEPASPISLSISSLHSSVVTVMGEHAQLFM